jgi:hypothetical protein
MQAERDEARREVKRFKQGEIEIEECAEALVHREVERSLLKRAESAESSLRRVQEREAEAHDIIAILWALSDPEAVEEAKLAPRVNAILGAGAEDGDCGNYICKLLAEAERRAESNEVSLRRVQEGLRTYGQHLRDCARSRKLKPAPGSGQCCSVTLHSVEVGGWTEHCQLAAGHSGPHKGTKSDWADDGYPACTCGFDSLLSDPPEGK